MSKKIKIYVFVGLLFFLMVITNFYNINVYASEDVLNLHEQTKINNTSNDDYVSGQDNYIDYQNDLPSITVLTHGFGELGYCWSNNSNKKTQLSYNSSSLINKIFNKMEENAILYIANASSKKEIITDDEYYYKDFGMKLYKYSYNDYVNSSSGTLVSSIDDITGHIILVFNSSIPNENNNFVYDEFEYILDTISLQYKELTGKLPKLNLVGHSRGGITNIMYASDHPYNVSSIISMGTPYNGSKLGQLEFLLDFMGYVNDEYVITKPGVEDILTESRNISIRNKWNDAYELVGVNINAIAYGSTTSIGLLEEMIDDVESNPLFIDYQENYGKLIDVLKIVIDVSDEYPNFTSFTIDLFDGVVGVVYESNGTNVYADLFSYIDPKLSDLITYEEVSEVVQLINVVNNEIVIMDDLFINLDSQLGLGFSDGIDYQGFTRYMKTFRDEDYTSNRAIYDQPGIVHNLEPMNDYYTTSISNTLEYNKITNGNLSDENIYDLYAEKGQIINYDFNPLYTANRTFNFEDSKIFLYSYNIEGDKTLVGIYENELTMKFDKDTNYIITVLSSNTANRELIFYISDIVYQGTNYITIDPGDEVVMKVQSNLLGYYLIDINHTQISLKNEEEYADDRYYIYVDESGINKYIYLSNSSSSRISFNLHIIEPNAVNLNEQITIDDDYKIVKYKNNSNYPQSYQLSLLWSSGSEYVTFLKGNSEMNTTVENFGTSSTYTFILNSNENCYIIYSSSNYSITSKLMIDENMMRWKINDTVYNSLDVTLPRDATYNVSIVYYSVNGIEQSYDCTYITTNSTSNFTFSNNILNIKTGALIGYDITIYPSILPSYMLTITIGPKKTGAILIENHENVIVEFSGESAQASKWKINGQEKSISGSLFYITSLLPTTAGNSTIEFISATYNNVEFFNNAYFNVSNQIVNNLYGGGSGTSNSPYLISCARHLDNIRKCSNKYFSQTCNITTNTTDYWIPISNFSGFYEGNNYYINMLSIEITSNSLNYGFFATLSGTIQNSIFRYAGVFTTGLSSDISITDKMYVGIVAGYVSSLGKVINCSVHTESFVRVKLYQSLVSGLVGFNKGTLTNCYVDANVQASGRAGGITGENGGTISECSFFGTMYYYYNSDNGIIGGIVGFNETNGNVVDCVGIIDFVWTSPGANNDIYPYIGALIGYNKGSYSNCTIQYDDSEVEGVPTKILFVVTHDQEKYCFAEDDGRVGYNY